MRTSTSNYERLTLFALISLCPPAPRKLKWLYSEEHFGTNSPYPVIVFCLRSSKVGSNNITRRQNVLLTSLSRLLHSEYSSGAVGFLLLDHCADTSPVRRVGRGGRRRMAPSKGEGCHLCGNGKFQLAGPPTAGWAAGAANLQKTGKRKFLRCRAWNLSYL